MRAITKQLRRLAPHIAVVVIILLGAYLRLYRISEYMTFLGDEGRDMLVVKRMIVDHKFTLLGPTASVGGFFLGPIYYYFMLPFVWAWDLSPVGAAVMVALFGIVTIYLVYRLGRDMFDPWVGIAASALYSVSPLVIAYSRSSWNPNVVPFFATLLVYLLWLTTATKRPQLVFWVGVVLGVGLQLHYLFLFLFVVTAVWYVLFGRINGWARYYIFGVVGFCIGYGPFLAFELRHGFPNTISIFNFLREGEGTGFTVATFWNTIFEVAYRLFGRLVFRLPPPEQWVGVSAPAQFAWSVATKFSIFASVGLIGSYLLGLLRAPYAKRQSLVLLLVWLVVPLVLFGFYKRGIYDYYFGLFFALPFVFTALILRSIRVSPIGNVIAVVALSALVYLNWQGRPFQFAPNNQLGQARMIAQAAFEKAGGQPYNFALLANFNSDHAYRYFFEIWGNPPVAIENKQIDPERKTVTDQLIVICELPECKPLGHPLWEIAGFGRAEIAGEWQVSFVKIMRLTHYKGGEK